MFAAILTVFLYALCGVSNQRVAMHFGAMTGNFIRLFISTMILGVIVFVFFPDSISRPTFNWYFASGLIGFGLGDVALFLALERIGSRLAVLLTLCLAPIFAIAMEWIWLGNGIAWPVMIATAAILSGVFMALRPGSGAPKTERRGSAKVGIVTGVISGFGQGTGAVVSRAAEEVEKTTGVDVNGISAAFQRVLAGLVVAILVCGVLWVFRKMRPAAPLKNQIQPPRRTLIFWTLAAALFGPVIGVSCFQWALETAPSGIVLAIVAMTPIVMIPLAMITENDRPTRLAVAGAVIAVFGVIALKMLDV